MVLQICPTNQVWDQCLAGYALKPGISNGFSCFFRHCCHYVNQLKHTHKCLTEFNMLKLFFVFICPYQSIRIPILIKSSLWKLVPTKSHGQYPHYKATKHVPIGYKPIIPTFRHTKHICWLYPRKILVIYIYIYIYPHEIAPFTHKETRPNPQLNPQSNSKFYIVYLSNIVDL